jgi:hypothetical protein
VPQPFTTNPEARIMSNTPLPDQPPPQRFQIQPLLTEALLGSYAATLDGALRQAQVLAQKHRLPVAVWRHHKDARTGKTTKIELVRTVEHQSKARSS